MTSLLEIRDLNVTFRGNQTVRAVNGVSLSLGEGEVLALVGESGCGKSVVAHAIARLLPPSAEVEGNIRFQDTDLLSLDEQAMEKIRGAGIGVIFQNPSLALNPLHRIGRQVAEPLRLHRRVGKEESLGTASRVLSRLGFPDPEAVMALYPSQSSGGMNQRFVTAASTVLDPHLLIADEPTKGLDRERVDGVVAELGGRLSGAGSALLLITHDLSVARAMADTIAVMYAGEVVEEGSPETVLSSPLHPYTRGLVGSLPENGFVPVPGLAPSPVALPGGCRFHPRCPDRLECCTGEHPLLFVSGEQSVRCWRCR